MTGFINTLLDLSLKGSLVIGIILVLRLALKKAPKIFSYSLWAIAFVSLILPFSIKSPLAFTNFLPGDLVIKNEVETRDNFIKDQEPQGENNFIAKTSDRKENFQAISPSENGKILENSSTNSKTLAKEEIYFYIWLSGVSILVITSALSTFKLKKKLKDSKQVDDNVYENDRIPTAFVFGLIKPKIYLPRGLSSEEEKYIKKHEQVHIERLDHLWKFLAFVITIVHFFNPLVWLAYYLMGLDMELSCDEKVIKDLGHGIKKDYSQSLLAFSTGRKILTASPLAFGENNTKTRIKNILAYRKPKKFVLAVCFILIALVAVGCLTERKAKESVEKPVDQEEFQAENFDSKEIYSSPEEFLKSQIENQIASLFSSLGYEISDYRIDELKSVSEDLEIDGEKIEVYKYDYSLKTDRAEDLAKTLNGKAADDFWVSGFNRTPYLIFEKVAEGYKHKGYIDEDKFSADLDSYLQELMVKAALVFQDENASVEDYAKSYIGERILALYSAGAKVSDYKIDSLEKFLSYDDIRGKAYEVYKLNYSLQFADEKSYNNYDGFIGQGKGDRWIGEFYGDNYMIFQLRSSGKVYIDTTRGVGSFLNDGSKEANENALREILERKNIIPRETYASDHYVASYRDFVGRANKVLLSQEGQEDLWLVERWMDENGTVYYEEKPSISKDENWRKDPQAVALDFINSMTTVKLSADKVQVEKLENLDDFYKLPESIYLGYIEEVKTDQDNMSDLIHVTLVEWLTQDDEERAKALGLDINEDMPSGFYVNKTQILETFFLDDDTKYYIGDYILSSQADPSVSKKVFIDYVKANKDVLFEIYSIGGKAIKIQEAYLP
ncbi:M56 family metallopeptidase [Neofamilia massiliensis]|uniref:M56 family metallopeptidase n=1 Tax=Neofamilia massiliensis TaxID=1673724 RepID=UPI0006BB56D2|nr:M56 family metallopeptidase [Neofamilia massiliensis]